MQFTEDHDTFRKVVRDVVEKEINPHVERWEAEGMFPAHELFPKLGAAGLLGLEYDPAYGGQGADHSYTVIYGEELGRADCLGIPMAVSVQTDMATPSLAKYGSEDLKQRYLAPAIRGEHVASICVSEPDAGSDVANVATRAVRDGDEWVINGTKMWITNGTQADWLCLLARTSDEGGYAGMSQIIVPTDTPGVSVSRKLDKLGMRSSDTAELSFVDARVPVDNTIGDIGRGFQQQMNQFQNERMIAAYTTIGACERALDRTKEYLADRKAFGGRLLDRQHIQFELGACYAELDLLRQYNYACCDAYLRGEDTSRYATIAKWKLGKLGRHIADVCLQFHGGMGYVEDNWTARFFRDIRLWAIGGGADEVMMRTLCRMEGMPGD
ncbi:MAG: acyl-CoA dehydrogenase family protein [Actinomycetota bacterium]|nr:acyl-CoA dehydrogenase family protein [Actinomycetota bacterium]